MPDGLNPIAEAVMYVGLFWWIFSTIMFIYRGFRRDGRLRFNKALTWFVMIFAGLILWIAGLTALGYKA